MTRNGATVVELEKRIAHLEEQLTQVHLSLILMRGNTPSDTAPTRPAATWTRRAHDFEPQEERE